LTPSVPYAVPPTAAEISLSLNMTRAPLGSAVAVERRFLRGVPIRGGR
jgi:hypothetical protein